MGTGLGALKKTAVHTHLVQQIVFQKGQQVCLNGFQIPLEMCIRDRIAYWAANPYSTQTKKTVFDSIKSSRDFLLI